MLQQTQVSRVLPKYAEFMRVFPTVEVLAKAAPGDVLRVWKGMGYNRRALYLQRAAASVMEHHKGVFPKNESELMKLPGLGIYTARALLVFAYKKNVSAVDTNIRQIIIHYFFDGKAQPPAAVADLADQLVPKGKSWEWHQALMDFGALALPKIKGKDAPSGASRTSSTPFKQTNRFFRGRIIDRLREGSYDEKQFVAELAGVFDKPEQFVKGIIEGLRKDGLVSTSKSGIIRLPAR